MDTMMPALSAAERLILENTARFVRLESEDDTLIFSNVESPSGRDRAEAVRLKALLLNRLPQLDVAVYEAGDHVMIDIQDGDADA
jgi:hypothetical protein